jgi:hypothetical protein
MSSKERAQSQSIEILQGNTICFFSTFFLFCGHMDDTYLKSGFPTPITLHMPLVEDGGGSGVMSFQSEKRLGSSLISYTLQQGNRVLLHVI